MRDGERIKEKIEIVLDSRQVVSIVLGAAVVLGTVFYLGVTVGRDLAGGKAPAAVDPLERLDQQALALQLDEKLTFAESLTGEPPPEAPAAIGKAEAEASRARAEEAAAKEAAAKEAVAKEAAAREAAAKEAAAKEAAAKEAAARPAEKEPTPKAPAAPAAGGFTVQVGAFPTRTEADALVARLRSQGLSPYVVAAEVQGKGLFHRVRLGRFRSREEARRYLEDLQRETSVSGFVAQVDG